ncbi:MAG: DUF2062 domain-containing protein [Planctomycetes bacterium]|nr:DUF2062 domain-containing protein [Planctomycetota bacterium]
MTANDSIMTTRHQLLIRFRPVLRFVKTRILHIDDAPDRIARGIAAGLFTAYLPLFGLHIILALLFAAILRANKIMALLFVWISNPFTAVFIYYPCYKVGRLFLGFLKYGHEISPDQLTGMLDIFSVHVVITQLFTAEFWRQVATVFTVIGLETLVGGILIGLVVAKIGYWTALNIINRYRKRKSDRRTQLEF